MINYYMIKCVHAVLNLNLKPYLRSCSGADGESKGTRPDPNVTPCQSHF